MFDFIRRHTKLFQFVLVLLVFPSFVFFGIQGYSRFTEGGAASTVAKVGSHHITQAEWDNAWRNQLERLRRQMPNADASMLDTPQMRFATLQALVRENVMLAAADRLHLTTTDARLQHLFAADPQLAIVRNADGSLNRDALLAQGMSPAQFTERLRQDYSVRQVVAGIDETVLAPPAVAAAALDALFQQRQLQLTRFDSKDYAAKIEPTDAQLKAWYDDPAHAAQFEAPDQAQIQYAMLDLDTIAKGIKVSEDDLRKYYEENKARFGTPEERRASHILVKVDKNASAEERAKAKAKAESILEQLRKSPDSFAELAKKDSDDPGSAEKGGDLDFFGRGAMVKPFEDEVFKLKPGEISGIVQSDFGYHIIKLTAVRGGQVKPFDAVRGEIEAEAKKQQAQKRFADAADQFTNTVYEQSDSLKPAADKLGLEVKTATVTRQPAPGATGPLASAKLLAAVFGNDALRNKRNTEAIETGPNQLVSARVVQYTPAHRKPFDEVKAQVHEAVVQAQASELARKAGEALLAAAKKDPALASSGQTLTVSRVQRQGQPPQVVDAALKADASKLPAWIGIDLGSQGYAVARVEKVLGRDPAAGDPKQAQAQYGQAWSLAEQQAYYDALKTRYKAEVLVKPGEVASTPAS
ncbi:MAG: SurA N-terminal domain-containing protein [Betaproteobacteria bacterium]